MKEFFLEVMWNSIEQINKSETGRKKEADTSENIESLANVDKTFLEVLNLSYEVKSQHEEDNKLSKQSKKKISAIEVKLNNLFQNIITSTEIEFDNIIVLVIAYRNLSHVYMTKDNCYTAKDYLEKCMELLKGRELHPKVILISIHILLQLNVIWRELKQLQNCFPLLDKAIQLYLNYTKEEKYPAPFNADNFTNTLRGADTKTKIKNSKIDLTIYHKITLDYIEELYCIQPKDMHKFVIYVHNLLNQQLNKTLTSTENKVSLLHWAKASADLCNYFLHHNRLIEMKNHLAAAQYMITRYDNETLKDQASGSFEYDVFEEVQANIARYWGIYGLKLLYLSIERLWYQSDKSCESDNIKSEFLVKSEEGLMKPLIFVDLEKDLENIVEITDTYVSSLDEAKTVFTNVLKWFDTAKSYYTVKNNLKYYADTILKICKAYKYYAYFEQSKSKRIKIIKQQIKILEKDITLFSSHVTRRHGDYDYCKSIYFELAILYSTLLDMSEELENFELTDDMKMEIRQLVESVLYNFNNFSLIT